MRTTHLAVFRSTIHVWLKNELIHRYKKLSIRNLIAKKVKNELDDQYIRPYLIRKHSE